MSICINPKNTNDQDKIKEQLTLDITINKSKINNNVKKYLICYLQYETHLQIPINLGLSLFPQLIINPCTNNPQLTFKNDISFTGKLRDEQRIIRKQIINDLNTKRCSLMNLSVGKGKTITAINIACRIKLRTLIIVNRLILIQQWKESIKEFTSSQGIVLSHKENIDIIDSDFYIINAINLIKINQNILDTVGLVIMDEVHLLMTENSINGLLRLRPIYLLGVTATPYRYDNTNILFDYFFGYSYDTNKNNLLNREHNVYISKTTFCPEIKMNRQKKVDWNYILNQQSENKSRNQMIINIIKQYTQTNFLVLVKRIIHADIIQQLLINENINVYNYCQNVPINIDDSKTFVIIGTVSKIGVGFNIPSLTGLIVGGDIKNYFIQSLGRVFRTINNIPKIFDFEDDYSILKSHLRERIKIYKQNGGNIIHT